MIVRIVGAVVLSLSYPQFGRVLPWPSEAQAWHRVRLHLFTLRPRTFTHSHILAIAAQHCTRHQDYEPPPMHATKHVMHVMVMYIKPYKCHPPFHLPYLPCLTLLHFTCRYSIGKRISQTFSCDTSMSRSRIDCARWQATAISQLGFEPQQKWKGRPSPCLLCTF